MKAAEETLDGMVLRVVRKFVRNGRRSTACDEPEEDRKAWSSIMETLKDEGPAK